MPTCKIYYSRATAWENGCFLSGVFRSAHELFDSFASVFYSFSNEIDQRKLSAIIFAMTHLILDCYTFVSNFFPSSPASETSFLRCRRDENADALVFVQTLRGYYLIVTFWGYTVECVALFININDENVRSNIFYGCNRYLFNSRDCNRIYTVSIALLLNF